jgi:aminoglycoside phosphotransferase (APT) family kinase protein
METSTGSWAVKELLERRAEDDAVRQAAFQEAAVAAGVPAPRIRRTVDGRVLLDLEDGQVRVYAWVEVKPPDLDLDPASVGRTVAAIHRLGFRGDGAVHPWYTDPVGGAAWDDLFRRLTRAGNPQGERLAEHTAELCALEQLLSPPAALQLLHLDLWADNVRATSGGGLCVLDWENAGTGDPSQELALVLAEFCSESAERAASLQEAYVDAGGPGRVRRPEDFSMAIAQLGHILEWQCENWLRARSPEARQHAEGAIEEFLTRPLTREVIERVLDGVT